MGINQNILIETSLLEKFQHVNKVPDEYWEKRVDSLKECCDLPYTYDIKTNPNKINTKNYWKNEKHLTLHKNFPYSGVFARKPGRKQNDFISKKDTFDNDINWAVIQDGSEIRDLAFKSMWTSTLKLEQKKPELVSNLLGTIYRMGYMLDHKKNTSGKYRIEIDAELEEYYRQEKLLIESPNGTHEISVMNLLFVVEGIMLDEDLRYFRTTKHWHEKIHPQFNQEDKAKYSTEPFFPNRTKWKLGRVTHSLTWMSILEQGQKLRSLYEKIRSNPPYESFLDFWLSSIQQVSQTGTEPQIRERDTNKQWHPIILKYLK